MNVETAMTKRETGSQPAAGAFVIPSPAIRNTFQCNDLGGGAFDGHSWTQTLEAQAPEATRFSRADEDARRSGDSEASEAEQAPVAERQALSGPRKFASFEPAAGAAGHVPYRGTCHGGERRRDLTVAARKA